MSGWTHAQLFDLTCVSLVYKSYGCKDRKLPKKSFNKSNDFKALWSRGYASLHQSVILSTHSSVQYLACA